MESSAFATLTKSRAQRTQIRTLSFRLEIQIIEYRQSADTTHFTSYFELISDKLRQQKRHKEL